MLKNSPKTIVIDPQNPTIHYWMFDTLPSTHQFALTHHWELESSRIIVIFARTQTNGMGSHGRRWISQNHNFHINLVFTAEHPLPFSQIAAWIACQQLTRETHNCSPFQLKWPNDMIFNGKKIGGCLSETRQKKGHYWVTIGIGINANPILRNNEEGDSFAEELTRTTSLAECLQRKNFTDEELFASVQAFSRLWVQNLAHYSHHLSAFYRDCQQHWLYLHQAVQIFDEDKKAWLTGIFESVTINGALQLKDKKSTLHTVLNGTGLCLEKRDDNGYDSPNKNCCATKKFHKVRS